MSAPITAADIETWARVEAALSGKARDLCAATCDHPPRSCKPCGAEHDPGWRRQAFTIIQGGLTPSPP